MAWLCSIGYLSRLYGIVTAVQLSFIRRAPVMWIKGEKRFDKRIKDGGNKVWIRNRGKQWADSVKGNNSLFQLDVNIDLINPKLC